MVFVTGEPGIGKTTLIDAFISGLAAQNLWVSRGQCVPHFGAAEAYGPLLELLGRFGRERDGAPLIAALERYAPTWLLALPGVIGERKRAALERRTQGTSRERMRRELIEALEAFSAERPGILVLEDLHWSDVATLDWLMTWAERRELGRLLVIGTYRPVEVIVHDHPLSAVVHELRQHGRCQTLALTGLGEEAVAAYLCERFAHLVFPPELGGPAL